MALKFVKKSDLKLVSGGDKFPGAALPFSSIPSASYKVPLTEDDIAEEFAKTFHYKFRFDHEVGYWYVWNGNHWDRNKINLAFHYARLLCRNHRGEDSKMANRSAIMGVELMARADPRLAVTSSHWDNQPYLLGTPTGTVDLKTGELKPSDPNDFITMSTSIAPAEQGTPAPKFFKFLKEITDGDQDLIRFLQMWFGYCLTGDTKLQCLLFVYGTGGNGKGVLMNTISQIMGTYAASAAVDTFTANKQPRHLTELAMLRGARLVTVSETDKEQAWSESRINQLTGGDPITANLMRKDHFTYIPKFKIMVSGNHKPKLGTVNEAATRRYNIIPFSHKPAEPDPNLADSLKSEYPAILRWMIDGCIDWQANGLVKPQILVDTTQEYFEEQNTLKQWIMARCENGPDLKCSAKDIFASWKDYCDQTKEIPGSLTSFGTQLAEAGFKKKKSGVIYYLGIDIKKNDKSDMAQFM